jgi:superfamily II DNA or RNA helicase
VPARLGALIMATAAPTIPFRLTPRSYQYEAVAALLAAAARGVQRPLLVLPTGTGKTIVFALLVQRRGGRSLILAHRDELIHPYARNLFDRRQMRAHPVDQGRGEASYSVGIL